jgi:hypothetical protein
MIRFFDKVRFNLSALNLCKIIQIVQEKKNYSFLDDSLYQMTIINAFKKLQNNGVVALTPSP